MPNLRKLTSRLLGQNGKTPDPDYVLILYREFVDGVLSSYEEDYERLRHDPAARAMFPQLSRTFYDEVLSGIDPLLQYAKIKQLSAPSLITDMKEYATKALIEFQVLIRSKT